MKKFFKLLLCFFIVFCIFLIISKPEIYVSSAFEGLKLWATTVLPALLPFFFLTALLSSLGVTRIIARLFEKPCRLLFNTGGASAYAFIMSLLSGYPVGSKTVSDMKTAGILNRDEAVRCSAFCSTSGPIFVIGSVGFGMFHNKNAGFLILISHLLSAVICGVAFRFYGSPQIKKTFLSSPKKSENALYDCVYSSVLSVSLVGGFICLFYLFSDALQNVGLFSPLLNLLPSENLKQLLSGFLYGLIECTKGCKNLSISGLSPLSVALSSALISFGGLSVWAQSIIFLSNAKIKPLVFYLSKILQAIFSFLLCFLLYPLVI
ncbi:MAG: hypothetical protein IJW64_01210 [Clostridia bacterium]|nr:hypothetical protein [Clostridia bacterium]